MTEAPADRTYWHVPGARSWHAESHITSANVTIGLCGRSDYESWGTTRVTQHSDRVPSDGHLCGSCARVIASRTDIENHSVTATAGIP